MQIDETVHGCPVAVVHLIVRVEILALQVKSGPPRGNRLWLRPQAALWKMKDRPFEVGFREQASNHPKRHRSKAVVVSVGGKGRRYRSGVDHGDERERTPDDVSKHFLATSKPGALLGQGWGVPDDGPTGVRHEGGVILASRRNVRTCRSDVTGAGQAGGPCKSTKAEHRGGVARSSGEGSVMGLERRVVRWECDGQPDTGKN